MTVLILLIVLIWTLGLVLAVLGKLLPAPDRNVRVSVRPLPWPRIEIAVDAVATGSGERRTNELRRTGEAKPDRRT